MRTFIAIVAAVLLAIVLIQLADDSDASPVDLWIDDIQMDDATDYDGETWTYSPATDTLTFRNGANLQNCHREGGYIGVVLDMREGKTLSIVLEGNAAITGSNCPYNELHGIYEAGSLRISGNGSLTFDNPLFYYPIEVMKDFTMNGGTVTMLSSMSDCDININGVSTMDGGYLNLFSHGSGLFGNFTISGGVITTIDGIAAGYFVLTGGAVRNQHMDVDEDLVYTFGHLTIPEGFVLHSLKNVANVALTCIQAGGAYVGYMPMMREITFDANGGTCYTPFTYADDSGKIPALPLVTRDGYTFDGWFTELDGGTLVTAENQYDADTTIYAHWTEIPSDSHEKDPAFLAISGTIIAAVVLLAMAVVLLRKQ